MYAFSHIAAFYDAAYDNDEMCPRMTSGAINRAWSKYAELSDGVQRPDYAAQARYDAQWGTCNGYSKYDLAPREW